MKLLLDTCILSELCQSQGAQDIRKTLSSCDDDDLFVSAITIGEISKGISLLPESRKKHELGHWLDGLEQQFSDRILPIDRDLAVMWGELTARARLVGVVVPVSDGLIAATALCYGLHVMTRNTKHFHETGVFIKAIESV